MPHAFMFSSITAIATMHNGTLPICDTSFDPWTGVRYEERKER